MTLQHPIPMSEEEFDRQFAAATQRGQDALQNEPQAAAVKYDPRRKVVVVSLTNACSLTIPVSLLEGLTGASPKQLAHVVTTGQGIAIEWPDLDQGFTVAALLKGIFGFPPWMKTLASRQSLAAAELGRRGGQATSEAKTTAARANGAKGGRPRKLTATK